MRYDSLFNEHYDDADHNLTLAQLIDKLFQFNGLNKICFAGTGVFPSTISPYCGQESHLAINYDDENKEVLVKDFHKMLLEIVPVTNPESLIWASPNNYNYTKLMITDVVQMGNIVYLITLKSADGY